MEKPIKCSKQAFAISDVIYHLKFVFKRKILNLWLNFLITKYFEDKKVLINQ